jgi:hypothetical protein
MQPYQDDRVRPDSDDVDNQEPVQLGGRRLVRSRDTMRSTRPRVVIKNHRSEPYTNNILVNVWERLRCLSHCCHADADDIEKILFHGMLTIFLRL